jgi:tetratricopeptide (TPR) repeat protein
MRSLGTIPIEAITLYRQALEMSSGGNHESALKNLDTAVMLAPKFALAHCEMGHCYEKLGRFGEAILKFDTVLQIYPLHVEAEMSRDRILEKMGKKR